MKKVELNSNLLLIYGCSLSATSNMKVNYLLYNYYLSFLIELNKIMTFLLILNISIINSKTAYLILIRYEISCSYDYILLIIISISYSSTTGTFITSFSLISPLRIFSISSKLKASYTLMPLIYKVGTNSTPRFFV